jgi:hypothetical protein
MISMRKGAGLLLLLALDQAPPAGAQTRPDADPPSLSSTFLAAVIEHLQGPTNGAGVPLTVDPHPVRSDRELGGVRPGDLLDEPAVLEFRTRALPELGIGLASTLEDMRCLFSVGILPPQEMLDRESAAQRNWRMECGKRAAYRSAIFGLPLPAVDAAWPQAWCIRAILITRSSYQVYDLELAEVPGVGWRIVGTRRTGGAAS